MIHEKDIVYEDGEYWVLKTDKAYEVYENRATHSLRRDVIGRSFPDALNRAITTCTKRNREGRA